MRENPADDLLGQICMADTNVSRMFDKDHPFPAMLSENRLLNQAGSAKETRHFVVEIGGSGLSYKAGDSLGVFPSNRPEEVDEILRRLGCSGAESVLPAALRLTAPISLREALAGRLALAKPARKALEVIAAKLPSGEGRSRLEALLLPDAKDSLATYLEEREFIDLLEEFPAARFSAQEFVDLLRRLMPRLYSIASSPRAHPNSIHLTVAVVRYTTNGRQRAGVCSTYLADRAVVGETPVPVFVSDSHFGPPPDGACDCIMVGPGTGIAPFRAFMQDRVAAGATGRNWLFFGDQKQSTDFLYESEWRAYQERGQLARLETAFSRDQAAKVYVQDRMRENAAELWSWINGGAYFYVCGDAKRMAKDVDAALHALVASEGSMSPEAAVEYVRRMKKESRYQRDVY